MFLYNNLKPIRPIVGELVQCPVKGCEKEGPLRSKADRINEERFLCLKHRIYITKNTFIYKEENDNFLWNCEEDSVILNKIKTVKRETHRLGHENSEDAVTWNVFRYLERNGLLESYLEAISGRKQHNPEVIYWTYSKGNGGVWVPMKNAWVHFEKSSRNHRTEPDVIIKTDDAVFLVEAKLNSSNYSYPENQRVKEKYMADGWFGTVFKKDFGFDDIAVDAKRYELMRMWLLGSWMAAESGIGFYLLNLIRKKSREKVDFSIFIEQSKSQGFKKTT